ncbi:MAG TPA: PIG-L deacetylase family protein [Thermoanaerobaculia bacterium]|nr:PIG-L deacetylase family protein [Thermoanaerobaculia bacterium]
MASFEKLLERDLVPYEASRFEAKRVLVLAPHPDDETFGCGAAIAAVQAAGATVDVLVLSDGAGDEADPAARAKIATERMEETRRALAALGGGSAQNAGLRDRGLRRGMAAVVDAIARALESSEPDLVFVPSPVEVHPDHRAVADAFLDVVRRRPARGALRLAGATAAFFELSQPIRPNFLLDATAHAERKERAMAAFSSQNVGRAYPDYVRGLNAYRTMTLPLGATSAEAYFVLSIQALREVAPERLRRVLGPSLPPAALGGAGGILSRLRRR